MGATETVLLVNIDFSRRINSTKRYQKTPQKYIENTEHMCYSNDGV